MRTRQPDATIGLPTATAGAAAEIGASAEVVIPTLRWPARLVALLEERGAARSMVTLESTNSPAGIGPRYNDFVDHSTGAIHRLFPKPAPTYYRAEVDQPIEDGRSFELPMLIAHALYEEQRLVAIGASGTRPNGDAAIPVLVWATGTVAPLTYEIGKVADVGMKLRASYDLLDAALARGQTVRLLAPSGNVGDVEPDVTTWLGERGLEVKFVRQVDEALALLGLQPIPRASSYGKGSDGWSGNPYRGLDPFESEHRPVFFGRKRAREKALERLRVAAAQDVPFLLVLGQSGVGKSSLVRAGLIGDVMERAKEGGSFRTTIVTPGMGNGRPAMALLRGLLDLAGRPLPTEPLTTDELPTAFLTALSELEGRHASGTDRQTGLMVLDQLEEVFDASIPADEAGLFARELDVVVRSGSVWVIATMRSDALGVLDRLPEIAQLASDERVFRLDRPSPYELAEIIAAPAALAGKPFLDQRSVEDLAAAAARSPDSLPLLQTLLHEFFDKAGRGDFDAASFKRFGDFEHAVGRWAEGIRGELVRRMTPLSLDRALISLIRIDPETRRPLSRSVSFEPESELGNHLRVLVNSRLATVFDGVDGPQVRLAHEALVTHWPHLEQLARRLADDLSVRDELETRARQWIAQKGDPAELLRPGVRLELARQMIAQNLVSIPDRVARYVKASDLAITKEREAEQRRRAGRTRRVLGAAAVVLVILAAIAGVALVQSNEAVLQRDQARDNNYRALAALSEVALANEDTIGATKLALAAWPRSSTSNAKRLEAVLAALSKQTAITVPKRLAHPADLLGASFAPYGDRILTWSTSGSLLQWSAPTGSQFCAPMPHEGLLAGAVYDRDQTLILSWGDGTVKLWDANTCAQVAMTMRQAEVDGAAFSGDGSEIVSWSRGGGVMVWDTGTGLQIGATMTHDGEVRGAKFSPDGTRILSWSDDETVRLWDARSGKQVGPSMPQKGIWPRTAFSKDGSRIVSWSIDGPDLKLWDAASSRLIRVMDRKERSKEEELPPTDAKMTPNGPELLRPASQIAIPETISDAAFSDNGQVLLSIRGRVIRLWNAADGTAIGQPLMHDGSVRGAIFSPDGSRILSWSYDNTVLLWNSATGEQVGKMTVPADSVEGAAFSVDGRRFVSWGTGVGVWDARTGMALVHLQHVGEGISGASFSPDGSHVLAWTRGDEAFLWDAVTGLAAEPGLTYGNGGNGTSLSPDGTRVLTVSTDGAVMQIDSSSGHQIGPSIRHGNEVDGAKYSPDGALIMSWGDGHTRVWDTYSGAEVGPGLPGKDEFGSIGDRVVSWSSENEVRLWSLATGRQVGATMIHEDVGYAELVSRGERIVSRSSFADPKTIKVWNAQTGQQVGDTISDDGYYSGYIYSAKNDRLATWSDHGTLRQWNPQSGFQFGPGMHHGDEILGATYSPDGRRLLSWSNGSTLKLWDAETGAQAGPAMEHPEGIDGAAFSADGTRILSWTDGSAAHEGVIRLWDEASGLQVGQTMQHDYRYWGPAMETDGTGAVFSPDQTRVLTWSDDASIRLWDAATGQQVGPPMWHDQWITGAAFDATGTRILSWSYDEVRLWDAASGRQIGQTVFSNDNSSAPVFLSGGKMVLLRALDGGVKLWHVAWPPGDMVDIACGLLPDKNLADVEARYGVKITDPICAPEQLSVPIDWQIVEREPL